MAGSSMAAMIFNSPPQALYEDRAFRSQVLDHKLVVHHFVAHVDRSAVELDRALDDLDRPVDACAETAGFGEDNVRG